MSEMSEIQKHQHIATKNRLLGLIKGKFDYWETVNVGDLVRDLENIFLEDTQNEVTKKDASALADLNARLAKLEEAARN